MRKLDLKNNYDGIPNMALAVGIGICAAFEFLKNQMKKDLLLGAELKYYYRRKLKILCDFTFKNL